MTTSPSRAPVDVRAARERQPQHAGHLVERLPRRVVDGRPELRTSCVTSGTSSSECPPDTSSASVGSGSGPCSTMSTATWRGEVVDAVERHAEREGQRLGRRDAHHQCAGQPRPDVTATASRSRSRTPAVAAGPLDRRHHRLEVGPAGHLGHHPAEAGVLVDAARDRVDEQRLAAHDARPRSRRRRSRCRAPAARRPSRTLLSPTSSASPARRRRPAGSSGAGCAGRRSRCARRAPGGGVVGAHLEHDVRRAAPPPAQSSSSSDGRARALRARGDGDRHDVGDVAAVVEPGVPATPVAVVEHDVVAARTRRRARPTTSARTTRRRRRARPRARPGPGCRSSSASRSTGVTRADRSALATGRPPLGGAGQAGSRYSRLDRQLRPVADDGRAARAGRRRRVRAACGNRSGRAAGRDRPSGGRRTSAGRSAGRSTAGTRPNGTRPEARRPPDSSAPSRPPCAGRRWRRRCGARPARRAAWYARASRCRGRAPGCRGRGRIAGGDDADPQPGERPRARCPTTTSVRSAAVAPVSASSPATRGARCSVCPRASSGGPRRAPLDPSLRPTVIAVVEVSMPSSRISTVPPSEDGRVAGRRPPTVSGRGGRSAPTGRRCRSR